MLGLAALLALASTARAQQAPRIPIVGYEIGGSHADSEADLQALMVSVAAIGDPFVEAGPSDDIGQPLGTIPRLVLALDAIGYRAAVTTRPAAGGVTVVVTLLPYDRVRYVFVTGNWPIQQDEIQRRITVRPGRPLPPPGTERTVVLEREREHVIDFLRSRGYFDATVGLSTQPGRTAAGAVDLFVAVDLGPAYPLGPITFTGNHALSSPEIDPMFRHADWTTLWTHPEPFTQKQLREDIDALVKRYRALGYLGVRVTSDFSVQKSVDRAAKNVRINIAINERKRIEVAFEGNGSQSDHSLRDQLTLITRGSFDDFEVGASADAIQHYYQEQGRFFARVDWRRERLSADEERIVFLIDEGPELKVRAVEFAGNRALPARELAAVVSVRKYPFLGIGSGGFVSGKEMEQDTERLLEHYHARGFLEAKVRVDAGTSPAAVGQLGATMAAAETVSRDAKHLFVRFTIEEGPRLTLVSEDFRTDDGGALPYDKDFLLKSVSLRPGAPYAPPGVHADAKRLARLFGDAGFPIATVEPDVNRVGDDVSLTWLVKLGPRMLVGPIFVRGNFVTRPSTILQQIRLRPGDTLSTTAVERSQRDIGFLQLFNNASPISFPGKEERRTTVPMVVEVEERYEQYSVVHLGAGASTDQKPPDQSFPLGVYVRGGYENRNWFGRGWNLNSQVTYGTAILRGSVGFLDRRFLGTLFRLDASLTYFRQETVRLGTSIRAADRSVFRARCIPASTRAFTTTSATPPTPSRWCARPAPTKTRRPSPSAPPSAASRPTSSGCAWTTACCRPAAFVSTLPRSWRSRRSRSRCARCLSRSATIPSSRSASTRCRSSRWDAFSSCAMASVSIRGSRSVARRCCRRSSVTSPAATPPFAGISSTAPGSRPWSFPWCRLARRARAEVSQRWSTARSAATCASCRTSICSSRSFHPGTDRCSWTTASSPTRSRASASPSFDTASASRRSSFASRSATSAWAGAGHSTPVQATPGSASCTSTSG